MAREDLYRTLLGIRRTRIAPHLDGVEIAGGPRLIGDKAVIARWRLSYGGVMTLACNLSTDPVKPPGKVFPEVAPLHWVGRGMVRRELQGHSTILWVRGERLTMTHLRDLAQAAGLTLAWTDYRGERREVG